MTTDLTLNATQKEWHGTFRAYVIGFVLSFLLTSASFLLAATQVVSGNTLVYSLIGLATAQTLVQLLCFLHIGQEAKPRWETITLCFTILTLLIIIIGSLWVMHDLDQRMMPHHKREEMSHD